MATSGCTRAAGTAPTLPLLFSVRPPCFRDSVVDVRARDSCPMTQQRHTSDARILDARTLADDFSALVPYLKPGLRVLDVGCGPGALSEGMAHIVGPTGEVVGIDRDERLIARASARAPDMAWLRFELRDALAIDGDARFDVVATARTLQWISADDLPAVLSRLTDVLVPGGWLVALDYNHREHRWSPDPPDELPWFVERFRAWREASRWLSDVLPVAEGLLPAVGLRDVRIAIRRPARWARRAAFCNRCDDLANGDRDARPEDGRGRIHQRSGRRAVA